MDDFDHAAHAFEALAQEFDHLTEPELLELGHAATTMILLRTKAGLDVDGSPFVPYSEEYAKERTSRGLSTRPDLAVKGHMLGAMLPSITGPGEVSVHFASALEATKAAAHNFGSKSAASVTAHSRVTHVDKKGRRVSREEVKRDQRRKHSRLTQRTEKVGAHQRSVHVPKREFMDIRQPREIEALEEMLGTQLMARLEKTVK